MPQEEVKCKQSIHPWLNDRCRTAIIQKNNAEGSDNFSTVQSSCDEVLRQERAKYVERLKQKLSALPRNSKPWWRLNRELLNRKAKLSSIPPLRVDGTWLVDAKEKADVFADTLTGKSKLAPEIVDTPHFHVSDVELMDFVATVVHECC